MALASTGRGRLSRAEGGDCILLPWLESLGLANFFSPTFGLGTDGE